MNILLQLDNSQHREVEDNSLVVTPNLTSFEEWIDIIDPFRNETNYNRQIGFCQTNLIDGVEIPVNKCPEDFDITKFSNVYDVANYFNNDV